MTAYLYLSHLLQQKHMFLALQNAILCSSDPKYPAQECERLLPQSTMNLNMLPTSRTNPKISVYATIFVIHDFNQCPLAPPRTKVIVHENTDNRWSWYPHRMNDFYIGPSTEHYRCVQFFMPATSSIHNVDTITFSLADTPYPKMETEDYL